MCGEGDEENGEAVEGGEESDREQGANHLSVRVHHSGDSHHHKEKREAYRYD